MGSPASGLHSSLARTIVLCYGTRPQIIKASRLAAALGQRAHLVRVDTGQHYDHELNAVHYAELAVPPPDRFLEVGSGPLPTQTALITTRVAELLDSVRPDAVVVIGDTISTLGGALAAALLRIPIVHVEAGLRALRRDMAEDVVRRVVDDMSTVLCAPSARAAERLRAERQAGRVVQTGDVAYDVLQSALAAGRDAHRGTEWPLKRGDPFVMITLHRAELVDQPELMRGVVEALNRIELPVVFPVHPRTGSRLSEFGLLDRIADHIHLVEPMGYLESVGSIEAATAVITDSGGVQREAYWLGTPCVTIREETEWPETVACGANRLVPPDSLPDGLRPALVDRLAGPKPGTWSRDAYGDGTAASTIAEVLFENLWSMPSI